MKAALLVPLSVVPALLLGLWLGGTFRPRAASATPAGPSRSAGSQDLGPLLEELRGLRADLRLALATRDAAPGSDADDGSGLDTAELVRALDDLREMLRTSRDSFGAATTPVPGLPGADGLPSVIDLFQAEGEGGLTAAHRFWTLRQVLERYGAPQSAGVDGNGRLSVIYRDGASTVYFDVFEGLVIQVRPYHAQNNR